MIPLALVIALSPLTIIPAVLVLHTPRPRPTGLAFLAGWLVGLAALTAVFVGISGLLGGLHKTPPVWASWLRVVVGAALVVVGVLRWLTRRRRAATPGWMRSLTAVTPLRAAVTAAVLAVARPEVLFVCAAAGLAIGTTGPGIAGAALSVVMFAAVAAASAAIPILTYAGAGDRLDAPLARLQTWMERNHAVMVAAILVVIGILVGAKGFRGLG
ncbi:GAP family protein [Mycobacterium sp.]|uniref:GAP family protein n=1 Tax=Mycobacterium sp. TaxID=1785 RepID=UPI0031D0911E